MYCLLKRIQYLQVNDLLSISGLLQSSLTEYHLRKENSLYLGPY